MQTKHLALLLFCWLVSLGHSSQAAMAAGSNVQGQSQAAGILIQMRNDTTPLVIAQAGGQARLSAQTVSELQVEAATPLTYQRAMSFGAHVLKFDQPKSLQEAKSIAERLMTMPNVEYAAPNLIIHPSLAPNDPLYMDGTQWSLNDPLTGANLPPAWDMTTGSKTVNIAVLDTGYTNHSELDYSQFATDGYDFISDATEAGDGNGRDSNARDEGDYCTTTNTASSWHGTAVMSIIGALTNNMALMAGINWHAKLIPIRVLGRCGGTAADLIDAIRWAVGLQVSGVPVNPNPAKVINMSLGGIGRCDNLMQSAIDDAHQAGAVIVVAAGNEGVDVSQSAPANCANVMAIAAHTQTGDIASFSNRGSGIALSAPGTARLIASCSSTTTYTASCDNSTSTNIESGTSFSAPMVSGVASLIFSANANLANVYVEAMIRNSARPFLNNSTCIGICGSGMLDAGAALALSQNFSSPVNQIEIGKNSGGAVIPMFWLGILLLVFVYRRFSPTRDDA